MAIAPADIVPAAFFQSIREDYSVYLKSEATAADHNPRQADEREIICGDRLSRSSQPLPMLRWLRARSPTRRPRPRD
ncbi:MAG TPA: hypothetical protein VEO95_07125, partial [Chthoniobacteraceae bacterium]|nr:hypothetical protein [Chthoniobacteraceae bacterium]